VAVRPERNGVLYINKSAQSKIWASIFSAYPGRVGVSRTSRASASATSRR
jgi:hypothetical protein